MKTKLGYHWKIGEPFQSFQRLRFWILRSRLRIHSGKDTSGAWHDGFEDHVANLHPAPGILFVSGRTFDHEIGTKLFRVDWLLQSGVQVGHRRFVYQAVAGSIWIRALYHCLDYDVFSIQLSVQLIIIFDWRNLQCRPASATTACCSSWSLSLDNPMDNTPIWIRYLPGEEIGTTIWRPPRRNHGWTPVGPKLLRETLSLGFETNRWTRISFQAPRAWESFRKL